MFQKKLKKNQIFFGIFLNKKKSKHIGNIKFHNIDIKKNCVAWHPNWRKKI